MSHKLHDLVTRKLCILQHSVIIRLAGKRFEIQGLQHQLGSESVTVNEGLHGFLRLKGINVSQKLLQGGDLLSPHEATEHLNAFVDALIEFLLISIGRSGSLPGVYLAKV